MVRLGMIAILDLFGLLGRFGPASQLQLDF